MMVIIIACYCFLSKISNDSDYYLYIPLHVYRSYTAEAMHPGATLGIIVMIFIACYCSQ